MTPNQQEEWRKLQKALDELDDLRAETRRLTRMVEGAQVKEREGVEKVMLHIAAMKEAL